MKLAVTADIHLTDIFSHSEVLHNGIPSRTLQFIDLAKNLNSFAEENSCDFVIIAGDFFDKPTLRPMVSDVAREFLRVISHQHRPVIICHGQHDIDTKTDELAQYHSALSIFKDYDNIIYADKLTTLDYKGLKIIINPWHSTHVIPDEKADVFISHGIVQGSENFEGYKFNSGFNSKELFSKFRLSIIGDLHNGHLINGYNGSKILIPGSPIQFNYKDSPVTGFWLCTITPEDMACEFTSIETFHPGFYHRFLYTDNPEAKSVGLVHYRYRPSKSKSTQGKVLEFKKDTSSITALGLSIIKQSKIGNQELVSDIFSKLIESLPSTDRKVPRSRLHSLEIHNFLSIEDFSLDLKEFPDNLVLTGKNGSGKTSLVEAIYWCLTGSTTKDISANDVRNYYAEIGTFVSVTLEVEEVMYKIGRGRTNSPQLQIFTFTEKWMPYTGNRTSMTQDTIYDLLGISKLEIKLLSYFPARDPSLFGSIEKSDRYSLLSTIVGMSIVDKAREKLVDLIKENTESILKMETKITTLRGIRENTKAKLSLYLAKKDNQDDSVIKDLERRKIDLEDVIKELEPSTIRENLDQSNERYNILAREKIALWSNVSDLCTKHSQMSKELEVRKVSLGTSLDGKCPTCGQSLLDENVMNALASEVEILRTQLLEIKNRESIAKAQLENKQTEYLSAQEQVANLKSALQAVQSVEDQLVSVNARLADAKDRRVTDYEPLIAAETASLDEYSKEIVQEEARLETLSHLQEAMNWIHKTLLKRNGLLISELAKQGQMLLQSQVDLLTEDESFTVIIEDDLSISAKFLGRQKAYYGQLSTGQARVVDVVMMCALSNLFTQMYGLDSGVLGLVVFDEVLSFLDPAYVDFCFNIINRINTPKRIIITHDPSLINKFDHQISVVLDKESDSSRYTRNW